MPSTSPIAQPVRQCRVALTAVFQDSLMTRTIYPRGVCDQEGREPTHVASGPRPRHWPTVTPRRTRTCSSPHPRRPDVAQPRGDGIDAHRPRGPRRGTSRSWRRTSPTRARRRGADGHRRLLAQRRGWLKPFAGEMVPARRRRGTATSPTPCTPRAARSRCRSCTPVATPTTRSASAPSTIKSPITPFRPRALSTRGVESTIDDFARCAALAREAGYDAVEIMGSEGYLINQFLAARTNDRTDALGRHAENRHAFRVEIVRRSRELVRRGLPHHLSHLAARPGRGRPDAGTRSSRWPTSSKRPASPCSTPASAGTRHACRRSSPRSRARRLALDDRAAQGRGVGPGVASNRINCPRWPRRSSPPAGRPGVDGAAAAGRPRLRGEGRRGPRRRDQHLHRLQPGLPRPRVQQQARHLPGQPARRPRDLAGAAAAARVPARPPRVAVVGAGPAGLAAAVSAAERGFAVTLFEKSDAIGGQFRLAMAVPGKEDFAETLRYYGRRLEVLGVDGTARDRGDARRPRAVRRRGRRDRRRAAAARPRRDRPPDVASYADVLSGRVVPGRRVAVIGAGGIGVDVSTFLIHDPADGFDDWMAHWGVGDPAVHPGGLTEPKPRTPLREVTLLQRKHTPIGMRPRQDLRLGPPRRAQAVRRDAGQRRDLRPRRRRRPARHRRRRPRDVRGRHRRGLRRPGVGPRAVRRPRLHRQRRRPLADRRRRRGRRAGRPARHRPGHPRRGVPCDPLAEANRMSGMRRDASV